MSQKGGVGKTSLARSLALVCAKAKLDYVLIDLDTQQYSIVKWLEVREAYDVSPRLIVREFKNARDALAFIDKGSWHIAIIDMPSGIFGDTMPIAREAHLIVEPTGPTFDDLYQAVMFFHELTAAGISQSHLVMALCQVFDDGDEKEARTYLADSGYEVLNNSIPIAPAYRKALNTGRTLTETGDNECNKRANALMKSIIEKIKSLADADAEDEAAAAEESPVKKGNIA